MTRTPITEAPRRQPITETSRRHPVVTRVTRTKRAPKPEYVPRTPPEPVTFFAAGDAARSTQTGSVMPVKIGSGVNQRTVHKPTRRNSPWSSYVAAVGQRHALPVPWEGPIHVHFVAYLARPKKPRHPREPITRPDVDNMTKGVLDLFKGIFFQDDSQVTRKVEDKIYTPTGATGLQVTITFRS